jgi:phospholipid/cholesterol/gamma-HCH transport system substrate-binding protein
MKASNNIKLGILVSASIAIFIVGIYFVGQKQQMFNSTFRVSGVFRDISGLQVGNNVRFSGIVVGVIDNIRQVTDTTVNVGMVINKSAQKFMKKNARAIIGTDGLMGNKILTIMPGEPGQPVLADNDVIETVMPVSMDEIMLNIKNTTDNASMLTDDLAVIMNNIRHGKGTMGKIMMDSSFATNIDKTIVNLKQGTGGFKKNMDAASHNFLLRGFLKKKKKKESNDQ